MIGKFTLTIENEIKIWTAEVYVTKGNCGCILEYITCIEMQIEPGIATTVRDNEIEKLCQNIYPCLMDSKIEE